MTKTREKWLDYIKALGVIFIVCSHAGVPISVSSYYYVPIFFIIAGYFFKDKNLYKYFLERLKRLYIPFVISNIIYIFTRNLLYYTGQSSIFYTFKELVYNSLNVLLFRIPDLMGAPTWFIFALFITSIEFMILYKVTSIFKKHSDIVLAIICIIMYIIGIRYINIFNKYIYCNCTIVTMLFINMIFYYIGYIIKKNNIKEQYKDNEKIEITSILLSILIIMAAKYRLSYAIDYRACIFSNNILALIIPCAGFIFLTFVADKIIPSYKVTQKIFSYIGKNSIDILLYHPLFFQIVGFIQVHFAKYKIEDINGGWNNISTSNNWRFLAILCGILLPIIMRLCIDVFKKIISQKK